jgi:hypothetical protein
VHGKREEWPEEGKAKPYQLKQLLRTIEKHNLHRESSK